MVLLVIGKFGKTIGFETVPLRKTCHFVLYVSQVPVHFNELIFDFLFRGRVVLFFIFTIELNLG